MFAGDAALVETVAHANSALHIYEDPHVIVDVGGQDIKIIVMHDGRVKDFRLNTACSAGNGYFLQAIARSFGYPVEEFAEAAFTAREMPVFGQGCVLFLQSEIANVQRHGWKPEEILAGLATVLPRNVFLYVAKAPNLSRFGWRFVLQGGTQRNLAAVKAQVDFIRDNFKGQARQPDIVLHEHCGEAGAIGAGLEAIRLWRQGRADDVHRPRRGRAHHLRDQVRRRHAVPLLQERVRAHVHRRVGRRRRRAGGTASRPTSTRRSTAASSWPGARRDRPRTSGTCATSRPPRTR